ncbi:hypothetical protein J7E97_22530 [Streptomyces sp. ISL-66]|uniref:hypothetical protein n=1 Tax=Streptomyces sp. ISL-66 TaxID=2819186 RepID=UPI001BEAFF2C|nr:hypothetical protein [Streptomyces sp. ISL-66]MBT2470567.1 hypothetical protein [Streptomyces sp. ISL-66]
MNDLAQIYDREFRVRGLRAQGWGRGLIAVAVLIWLWLGYLLLFPFTAEGECDSRVFHQNGPWPMSYHTDEGERCDAARDLGPMLAALLLSVPLAALGTGLYASGTSAVRTAAYAAEIARLNATKEV